MEGNLYFDILSFYSAYNCAKVIRFTSTQLYTQYTLQQKYLLLNIEICFGGVISNLFLLF